MLLHKIVQWGNQNPRKIFIIDGIGACISSVMLGVILVHFEQLFGIPISTLYVLAIFPCLFAVYDLVCYFVNIKSISIYIKGIAVFNLLYCFLSLSFGIYHKEQITLLGWSYLIAEAIIILLLASVELSINSNTSN
ncbi:MULTISPECIES: hypothetical protein [Flammeovirga]|uniref:Uncharacterized protein n=1 Tax=Flammeovirga agarivorans TaxID=2726742 RepID=A0A7X8SP34_9BACT|nr:MULTISPECIES: hypothetical protein [Flammeovirga]NLR93794.1 hypothetical protein [Flammeovirga agarivorans]